MASGHRKRKAELLRSYVLTPAGLTNTAEADRGSTSNQNALINTAVYASGGYAPVFTEGSTTLLSDAVSNADGVWTVMGYLGETSANAVGFVPSNVKHRYMPFTTASVVTASDTVPVLIYSKDGPQGKFNQYYIPTINQTATTGTIIFTNSITAAAGTPGTAAQRYLRIYVAGAFPSASAGTSLRITTGSNPPLLVYTSASVANPADSTSSFPALWPNGVSASATGIANDDSITIILPAGYADLTTSATYTIKITGTIGTLPTATGNNMFISASTIITKPGPLHNAIAAGINGQSLAQTSSLGSGFLTLTNYLSAVSASNTTGVNLFARYSGIYGGLISVSGSNNKIKKTQGSTNFLFEPYLVSASFFTASLETSAITMSYSTPAGQYNSFAPGLLIYITGSDF